MYIVKTSVLGGYKVNTFDTLEEAFDAATELQRHKQERHVKGSSIIYKLVEIVH
jgi:hypothetical protein